MTKHQEFLEMTDDDALEVPIVLYESYRRSFRQFVKRHKPGYKVKQRKVKDLVYLWFER